MQGTNLFCLHTFRQTRKRRGGKRSGRVAVVLLGRAPSPVQPGLPSGWWSFPCVAPRSQNAWESQSVSSACSGDGPLDCHLTQGIWLLQMSLFTMGRVAESVSRVPGHFVLGFSCWPFTPLGGLCLCSTVLACVRSRLHAWTRSV